MDIIDLVQSKPVLIGLHLGFAIIGLDAFFWLLGKVQDNVGTPTSHRRIALVGTLGFVLSWLTGGYYYVHYYGNLVKPIIKNGAAPWAHTIIMETKEHIFLFIIPLAITVLFLTMLTSAEAEQLQVRTQTLWLIRIIVGLALLIGAFGFIISAAARWGTIT